MRKIKTVVYSLLISGSQPLSAVGRDACPYRRHIPFQFMLIVAQILRIVKILLKPSLSRGNMLPAYLLFVTRARVKFFNAIDIDLLICYTLEVKLFYGGKYGTH